MTMPCPRSQHTGSSRSESGVRCHRLTARALPFVPKNSYRAYRGIDARCSNLHGHPFYSKGCSKAKASPATPPSRLPPPLGSSPGQLRLATVSLWWMWLALSYVCRNVGRSNLSKAEALIVLRRSTSIHLPSPRWLRGMGTPRPL